jgi:type I restriction enzyme S subunit
LTISSREFHAQKDLFCTGATQMALTNEGLARIRMPLPDENKARLLGADVASMLSKMAILQESNDNLRHTRNLLLPRLLSGQIDFEAVAA